MRSQASVIDRSLPLDPRDNFFSIPQQPATDATRSWEAAALHARVDGAERRPENDSELRGGPIFLRRTRRRCRGFVNHGGASAEQVAERRRLAQGRQSFASLDEATRNFACIIHR